VGLFRFVMTGRSETTRFTLAAGIASLVGPACAVLPYTDYLRSTGIAIVWLLAAIGVIGIGIGVLAFRKGSRGRRYHLRPDKCPFLLTGDS
jgi:hypothetical protein